MRKLIWILMLAAGVAAADETNVRLKDGTGKNVVEANCVMCHSLDYIQINSPFLDHGGWDRTVTKMIKAMGAPIRDEDAKVIVDYLATHYGK